MDKQTKSNSIKEDVNIIHCLVKSNQIKTSRERTKIEHDDIHDDKPSNFAGEIYIFKICICIIALEKPYYKLVIP